MVPTIAGRVGIVKQTKGLKNLKIIREYYKIMPW